jgi:hypothetical protein
LTTCSRGHKFYKSSACPVCPRCWPGYRRRIQGDFPKNLSAPALRALAKSGIRRLAQLKRLTESEVLELHGVGPRSIGILRKALKSKGLSFKRAKEAE